MADNEQFETLILLDDIPDALTLIERAADYRVEYNADRPHEAIGWKRPIDAHLGMDAPAIPSLEREESLRLLDTDKVGPMDGER